MRILIVDDELLGAQTLARRLRRCGGHDVTIANTAADAFVSAGGVDFVLVNLQLADLDGIEVCRRIRSAGATPVITFTERGAALDRILSLQAGADDCVAVPYQFRELLARIDAVLRRSRTPVPAMASAAVSTPQRPGPADDAPESAVRPRGTIAVGDLSINVAAREVAVKGDPVCLTRKEFDLLHYLARNHGYVVDRQQLMSDVWGIPKSCELGARASRTIDTHVNSLRNKLGRRGWIVTVRGVGFRLGRS